MFAESRAEVGEVNQGRSGRWAEGSIHTHVERPELERARPKGDRKTSLVLR